MNITFQRLKDCNEDYELLHKWVQKPYIYEWFEQRILSYEEVKEKYQKKLQDNIQELFIIEVENKRIGFVQIYPYEEKSYEFDIFIGEEDYLFKGYGVSIIKELTKKIMNEYHAESIIVRPFQRNERAIHCYQKCGYQVINQYQGFDTLGKEEEIVVLSIERK